MSMLSRNEIRLTGVDGADLGLTVWDYPGGTVARFAIYLDAGDDAALAEIDVPIEDVLPLVVALRGCYQRRAIATDSSPAA